MIRATSVSKGMRISLQSRSLMSYPMGYAYKVSKTMMPKISDTERAALNAGTGASIWISADIPELFIDGHNFIHSQIYAVGFDREIFSGNPSLKDLEKYSVKLSAEEKGNKKFTFWVSKACVRKLIWFGCPIKVLQLQYKSIFLMYIILLHEFASWR